MCRKNWIERYAKVGYDVSERSVYAELSPGTDFDPKQLESLKKKRRCDRRIQHTNIHADGHMDSCRYATESKTVRETVRQKHPSLCVQRQTCRQIFSSLSSLFQSRKWDVLSEWNHIYCCWFISTFQPFYFRFSHFNISLTAKLDKTLPAVYSTSIRALKHTIEYEAKSLKLRVRVKCFRMAFLLFSSWAAEFCAFFVLKCKTWAALTFSQFE